MASRQIAVICGGAEGVWEERARAVGLVRSLGLTVVSLAINDAGTVHPDPLDHWITLHPDKLRVDAPNWAGAREANGLQTTYKVWSQSHKPGVDGCARLWRDGSSGLTAIDVALNQLALPAAILCGIPMDDSLNVFRGRPWGHHKRYRRGFQKHLPAFRHRVRSYAGWTRQHLGAPTVKWLRELYG